MIVFHLAIANAKMIVRDKTALFWALAFPLLFVFVFGLFFRDVGSSVPVIAVVDKADDEVSRGLVQSMAENDGMEIEARDDEAAARQEVADGDLGYLLVIPEGLAQTVATNPPARLELLLDESNTLSGIVVGTMASFVDGANLELAQAPARLELAPRGASESDTEDLGYIDYLLPGLAVWGVMSFSVIGLATTMAVYREKRILRRIQSTPLRVRTFVVAQVLASLALSVVQAGIIIAVGAAIFGVPIPLSQAPQMAALILMGNLVFLNLGFIVGAFSKTVAAASGLGNAVTLPLMFMSGVFFPMETLPAVLRFVIEYLPLAPLLEMFRSVALESGVFWDFPTQLAIVAGWIALSGAVAMRTFRFR